MSNGYNNKKFIPDMKADWNMTQLDFMRIDNYFKEVDRYAYSCANMQYQNNLLPYVTSLQKIYRYLRPLVGTSERENIDKEFFGIRKICIEKGSTYALFIRTEKLHEKVMDIRQMHGAGIMAYKKKNMAADKWVQGEDTE